ncbi:MAG: ECF-type sigma factor [Planctomycetota bacterium]
MVLPNEEDDRDLGFHPAGDGRTSGQAGGEPPPDDGLDDPRVYDELHRIASFHMRGQPVWHTLSATALVHEAFIKLSDTGDYNDRTHYLASAARAMRSILVDHARRKSARKRDPGGTRQSLRVADSLVLHHGWSGEQLLEFEDVLQKLEGVDPELARIVELRFFTGCDTTEIGRITGQSPRTVVRQLAVARAWLQRELA